MELHYAFLMIGRIPLLFLSTKEHVAGMNAKSLTSSGKVLERISQDSKKCAVMFYGSRLYADQSFGLKHLAECLNK